MTNPPKEGLKGNSMPSSPGGEGIARVYSSMREQAHYVEVSGIPVRRFMTIELAQHLANEINAALSPREERWRELETVAEKMKLELLQAVLGAADIDKINRVLESFAAWKESRPSRAGEKGNP